jgi:polysaccharide biosynthesis transport protein
MNRLEPAPAIPPGSPEEAGASANLLTYLGVLSRRKWVMLPAIVLVPLLSVALTLRQAPLYEATAELFLNSENVAASLGGLAAPASASDAERFGKTQERLARFPEVASRTLAAVGIRDSGPYELLGASRVTSAPDADILYFAVSDQDPALARRLATAYAEQFVAFRNEVDSSRIERARKRIDQRLAALRAAGSESSSLYRDLRAKKDQLEELDALQTSNASVVRPADSAVQIAPRSPRRVAALGIGLGIVLAIALAFLADALDTRVRSEDEIEDRLGGLPLLGRIPEPSRELPASDVAMLTHPGSPYAESIRMLRVRLGLATMGPERRLIMVTSASAQEGKSTTIANLAVALAQAGRRVVLCDLDARRAIIHEFFHLPGQPGLTDVVAGDVALENSLKPVPIPPKSYWGRSDSQNGHGAGALEVLTLGRTPPDPGEFIGSQRVVEILETLRDRADVVLVDTPAMLAVGDAMTIAGIVDTVLVVVRQGAVRRSALRELGRVLASSPARPLGFVVTGSAVADRYDQNWYYGHPAPITGEQESIRR